MMAASASLMNIKIVILDVGEHSPAKQIVAPLSPEISHVDGSFTDPAKILELASKVDVITVEIEHVDVNVLDLVQESHPVEIHPSPSTIRIIQDKFLQKHHLLSAQVPLADFVEIVEPGPESIHAASEKLGLPLMLKSRTLAYDGRGNFVLRDLSQIQEAMELFSNRPLYAERWIPFEKEIAVMVVRTTNEDVISYPVVETVHEDNICQLVSVPLRTIDVTLPIRARKIAEKAVRSFKGAGIFGVEMFLLKDGKCPIACSSRRLLTRVFFDRDYTC
jgi:phosphoribosylaminoimidazole carboxylase